MGLLSITALKQHVETDLPDSAIKRLIDDAEHEIEERYGELETATETKMDVELATRLFLNRKAESITTVVEEVKSGGSYESTILAVDDYALRFDNQLMERLRDGTNPRSTWGNIVTVTYVPEDDSAVRRRVAIDLVKLAIRYNALKEEDIGDYETVSLDYQKERNALLEGIDPLGMA